LLWQRSFQKPDEALRDFKRASELNPSYPAPYMQMAEIYEAGGFDDEALENYDQAISADSMNHNAYSRRARLRWKVNDFEGAITDFFQCARMVDRDTARYDATWHSAISRDDVTRDPTHAVELARQLVKREPASTAYQTALGMALYRDQKWDAAIRTLDAAMKMEISPDTEGFRRHAAVFLAMAYCRIDNRDKALQWYRNAVERVSENVDDDLSRLFAEARKLLGITSESGSGGNSA
jgi:tetratricopeptide (TPR) repeat protein